jgi:hypothetical protein
MDSEIYQRHQTFPPFGSENGHNASSTSEHGVCQSSSSNGNGCGHNPLPLMLTGLKAQEILQYIRAGHLFAVSKRQRNGLILYKDFHAEFAGPGAAVGGFFDQDCHQVIPVGDLSLSVAETHEERKEAYLIRRQWIRLTQQFTDTSLPVQRAQMILNQFETYFDQDTINRIPDEAFALLVGVLPYTVRTARRTPGALNVKLKA